MTTKVSNKEEFENFINSIKTSSQQQQKIISNPQFLDVILNRFYFL
jgi:hypothetical protein